MAKYQSTNNSTDGPPSADSVIRKDLEENKTCELIIEERKTKRPEAASDVGVNIVLGDREVVFLTHKPITTLPVAEGLVNDLGIETEQSPIARNTKREGP